MVMEGGSSKPASFHDAVLNNNSASCDMDDGWEMKDDELEKDDVRKEIVDRVPTIDFSDRVYGLIDESMSKTLVVKLLRRRIGYNALWNKLCAMWKPLKRF